MSPSTLCTNEQTFCKENLRTERKTDMSIPRYRERQKEKRKDNSKVRNAKKEKKTEEQLQ